MGASLLALAKSIYYLFNILINDVGVVIVFKALKACGVVYITSN